MSKRKTQNILNVVIVLLVVMLIIMVAMVLYESKINGNKDFWNSILCLMAFIFAYNRQ